MSPASRKCFLLASLLLCFLAGWWFAWDLQKALEPVQAASKSTSGSQRTPNSPANSPPGEDPAIPDNPENLTAVELIASSQAGEIILRLPDPGSYGGVLSQLSRSPLRIVDQLDRLQAVRIAFDKEDDLTDFLADKEILSHDSLPKLPDRTLPGDGISPDARPLGLDMLSWIGADRSAVTWGKGVRIAILDTGVVPHSALGGPLRSIAITPFPENLAETHGHGTAVASIIAGSHSSSAPGIAPAAEILSIRVSGESGTSDSFAIAAGLLAAIDAGVHLINLSLGTYDPSSLLEDAIALAQGAGILIIAAAGNDGLERAAYPAAYPGVVSVAAVDALGTHLPFSNFGEYLYLSAPGYRINAAWPGERIVGFSGTSASAPMVTGAIAAIMSNGSGVSMTAAQALDLLTRHADDSGIAGPDSQYGFGIINLRRVMTRDTPGIIDAAVTDQRIVTTALGYEIRVTIQNRGSSPLLNTLAEITSTGIPHRFNVTGLKPGEVTGFTIPLSSLALRGKQNIQVTTTLTLSTGLSDFSPENNIRSELFLLSPAILTESR